MKYAIAIALLGVTSVSAAPYYVGENLQPKNNLSLGFADTMTKKLTGVRADTGNIATIELKAAYSPMEKTSIRAGLPFYTSTKDATGSARNALGNVSLGGVWTNPITTADRATTWGYAVAADVYVPTSRKAEGDTVGAANPTTDLYKYASKATALTPSVGLFYSRDMFSVKTNVGGVYAYYPKSAAGRSTTANHLNATWQLAGSWHATPNLHGNVEYNTIFLDSASGGGTHRMRHAVTPSISGNYEKVLASAFATIPVDKPTRDITNVAFGFNAGYSF